MNIVNNMEAIFIAAVLVLGVASYQPETSVTDPGVASLQADKNATQQSRPALNTQNEMA